MARALEGTDVPAGVRLHPDADHDSIAVREWINTLAIVILILALIPLTLWVKSINDEFAAAQTRNAVFELYLRELTTEANYDCSTLTALAKKYDLFLPSPGTCTVTVP